LNPKVSINNNGKTTEVPPSEHNYTNPICPCQYSVAIIWHWISSNSKTATSLASSVLFDRWFQFYLL